MYYIPVHPGCETLTHYFSSSCGIGMDSTKSSLRQVPPNLCFASGRICGSRRTLRCVRARNVDALFSMLVWDLFGFHKKRDGTRYPDLVCCIQWDLYVT
jgi:hypothetical protein